MDNRDNTSTGAPVGVLDPDGLAHTPPPTGEVAHSQGELHAPVYTSPVSLPAPAPSPGYSHGYGYTPQASPEVRRDGTTRLVVGVIVAIGIVLVLAIVAVVAALGPLPGNGIFGTQSSGGPVVAEPVAVPMGAARTADVSLNMGVGNVSVAGLSAGAGNLLEGIFYYDVPQWKPQVAINVQVDTGRLTVSQPSVQLNNVKSKRYDWDLRLNSGVPANLNVHGGVGNVDLNLGGLNLSSLTVSTGTGNATVDLRGSWSRSFTAAITGGVGNVTLRLPSNAGARVTVQRGLGDVNVSGLTVNGDVYTNASYGKSSTTLEINLKLGVGNARIEAGK